MKQEHTILSLFYVSHVDLFDRPSRIVSLWADLFVAFTISAAFFSLNDDLSSKLVASVVSSIALFILSFLTSFLFRHSLQYKEREKRRYFPRFFVSSLLLHHLWFVSSGTSCSFCSSHSASSGCRFSSCISNGPQGGFVLIICIRASRIERSGSQST